MIYAVTALIFGIPNIVMMTFADDRRFFVILITSLLVVTRYIGYIYLAGFALMEPDRIKAASGQIIFSICLVAGILLANAGYFLYRFGFMDMSVTAVCIGSIVTAGILLTHLFAIRRRGLNRSRLMKIVSGVLIAIGSTDICITKFYGLSPLIGLLTLFFGISTEKKSLGLAFQQTVAAAGSAAGIGIAVYYLRWYLDPALLGETAIQPLLAASMGLTMGILGLAYYIYARRLYSVGSTATSPANPQNRDR
jgi:hypothetical protein